MSGKRTKRIIAVFGGSTEDSVLSFAEGLGRTVAQTKQILLTGGTGPARDSVKGCAIFGADPSPWIGVDRKTAPGAFHSKDPRYSFSICSDLDHKRNYLEALMCDAAIGLKGGNGTISEVTSALSLQRPVALVGDHWKEKKWDLDTSRPQALDSLAAITADKFNTSGGNNHELDTYLSKEAIRSRLNDSLCYKYFNSDATAASVVDWIMSALPAGENFLGIFPLIESHKTVRDAYYEWLKEYAFASPEGG
jgi:predicted Rossmann-fold nucleotide-binding protein